MTSQRHWGLTHCYSKPPLNRYLSKILPLKSAFIGFAILTNRFNSPRPLNGCRDFVWQFNPESTERTVQLPFTAKNPHQTTLPSSIWKLLFHFLLIEIITTVWVIYERDYRNHGKIVPKTKEPFPFSSGSRTSSLSFT